MMEGWFKLIFLSAKSNGYTYSMNQIEESSELAFRTTAEMQRFGDPETEQFSRVCRVDWFQF